MKKKQYRRIFLSAAGLIFIIIATITVLNISAQTVPTERSDEEWVELFESVYSSVKENYIDDSTSRDLIYAAIKGMLESLDDPYSRFLEPDEIRDLTTTIDGFFGGLGMYISKLQLDDDSQEYIEVVSPIEGTPAFDAGLKAGDLIIAIEGDNTAKMNETEAVNRLRGETGTDVNIRMRRGPSNEFDLTITREIIEVPTVLWDWLSSEIAYVRITLFTNYTADDLSEVLKTISQQEYKGLILDLRNNPGGLLDGAVRVADLFFDDGLIVSLKNSRKNIERTYEGKEGVMIDSDIPIVVLINDISASAAEIVAGSLRDRRRAFLVGETSLGKGSVQEVTTYGKEGIRLTTSRYYTPSGESIDKVGIVPDEEVSNPPLSEEQEALHAEIFFGGAFEEFLQDSQSITAQKTDAFIAQLLSENENYSEWYLRRRIRSELFRIRENALQIFDLEYDIPLQRALELIEAGQVFRLITEKN